MDDLDEASRRDMVQCAFLHRLFARSLEGEMALKGGLAMRVGVGGSRLTKDVDLAADSAVPKARIQGHVRAACRDLSESGLVEGLRVTEPKQTDTTLRWKVSGMVGGSELHLTVEVSRRDRLPSAHVREATFLPPPSYKLPPVTCLAFDATALAASKAVCLSGREAPRDLWDLFVLVKAQVYPPVELLRGLGRDGAARRIAEMWANVEKMDYASAKANLLPYLPPEVASTVDEDAWADVQATVGIHVESWLEAVRDGEPEPVTAFA